MMKMATGEGLPPPAGCRNRSRLAFGGYGGYWRRNSRSILFPEGFRVYRYIYIGERNTSGEPRGAHEGGGRAQGGGRAPCLVDSPEIHRRTSSSYIYISIYPKNFGEHNRSGVPLPEASVATESQSRPVPAPCRRGQSLSGGYLHHPGALHDKEGVVHPRG